MREMVNSMNTMNTDQISVDSNGKISCTAYYSIYSTYYGNLKLYRLYKLDLKNVQNNYL